MTLSPLNQRRWQTFKKHKLAYFSLWIFMSLFIISLFSEFIANDKPLLVIYKKSAYFPIIKDYPETIFGGTLTSNADFRDTYVQELINKEGQMLWPIIRFNYQTINYQLTVPTPAPPSRDNWLGTDDQGRDVVARLLYGFRVSILFALILTVVSSIIGIIVGALQGYYGGRIDLYGQRFIEIWSGLPILFMLIILSSVVEPNFWWLLGIMLLFSWTELTGLIRAEFLRSRNLEYVRAARALGASDNMIMYKHILPNAMISTLTFLPFIFTGSIGALTSLDFLGFGLPPGSASLGELLAQGKNNLSAPWLGISSFVTISLLLTLLVFIGDGIRDALDPRKSF